MAAAVSDKDRLLPGVPDKHVANTLIPDHYARLGLQVGIEYSDQLVSKRQAFEKRVLKHQQRTLRQKKREDSDGSRAKKSRSREASKQGRKRRRRSTSSSSAASSSYSSSTSSSSSSTERRRKRRRKRHDEERKARQAAREGRPKMSLWNAHSEAPVPPPPPPPVAAQDEAEFNADGGFSAADHFVDDSFFDDYNPFVHSATDPAAADDDDDEAYVPVPVAAAKTAETPPPSAPAPQDTHQHHHHQQEAPGAAEMAQRHPELPNVLLLHLHALAQQPLPDPLRLLVQNQQPMTEPQKVSFAKQVQGLIAARKSIAADHRQRLVQQVRNLVDPLNNPAADQRRMQELLKKERSGHLPAHLRPQLAALRQQKVVRSRKLTASSDPAGDTSALDVILKEVEQQQQQSLNTKKRLQEQLKKLKPQHTQQPETKPSCDSLESIMSALEKAPTQRAPPPPPPTTDAEDEYDPVSTLREEPQATSLERASPLPPGEGARSVDALGSSRAASVSSSSPPAPEEAPEAAKPRNNSVVQALLMKQRRELEAREERAPTQESPLERQRQERQLEIETRVKFAEIKNRRQWDNEEATRRLQITRLRQREHEQLVKKGMQDRILREVGRLKEVQDEQKKKQEEETRVREAEDAERREKIAEHQQREAAWQQKLQDEREAWKRQRDQEHTARRTLEQAEAWGRRDLDFEYKGVVGGGKQAPNPDAPPPPPATAMKHPLRSMIVKRPIAGPPTVASVDLKRKQPGSPPPAPAASRLAGAPQPQRPLLQHPAYPGQQPQPPPPPQAKLPPAAGYSAQQQQQQQPPHAGGGLVQGARVMRQDPALRPTPHASSAPAPPAPSAWPTHLPTRPHPHAGQPAAPAAPTNPYIPRPGPAKADQPGRAPEPADALSVLGQPLVRSAGYAGQASGAGPQASRFVPAPRSLSARAGGLAGYPGQVPVNPVGYDRVHAVNRPAGGGAASQATPQAAGPADAKPEESSPRPPAGRKAKFSLPPLSPVEEAPPPPYEACAAQPRWDPSRQGVPPQHRAAAYQARDEPSAVASDRNEPSAYPPHDAPAFQTDARADEGSQAAKRRRVEELSAMKPLGKISREAYQNRREPPAFQGEV
eukprot:gene1790-2722_t